MHPPDEYLVYPCAGVFPASFASAQARCNAPACSAGDLIPSMTYGFSWSSSLLGCAFERLYLVVFRSVRRPSADLDLLREHDDRAYEEALESGGLLRYFKGEANEQRECLSFYLWETREQAIEAAGAASHKSAAEISVRMYESYVLDRYLLKKVVTTREERLIFEL